MSTGLLLDGLGNAGSHALLRMFLGPPASGGDTEAPTAPGTPTFSGITMSSATAIWASATDNVGVAGYEYRLDGGSIIDLGSVLTTLLSGLLQSTLYAFEVRAYDVAGNRGPFAGGTFTTASNTLTDVTQVVNLQAVLRQ